MSAAANNWLKDRPLLTVLFSFLGSLILAFTVRAVNISDDEKKKMQNDIDSKATIDYVDRSIFNHEAKEQIMLNRIENIITLTSERQDAFLQGQKDIVESIDRRLQRLENKN